MGLQIENGHTKIVNEVLEQLVKRCLLGSEYQVILFVIRKTWGWQKKEDIISLTQFELGTGLSRHTIIDAIKRLESKKILVKRSILGKQQIAYKFNKYHQQWLVNTTAPVQNKMPTSAIERLKLVKRSAHTKETTKENKKEFLKTKDIWIKDTYGYKKL